MFPAESMATALPPSSSHPPALFDQSVVPVDEYFTTKMAIPFAVLGPPPKSTVPENFPVTRTLPLPSAATARPSPPPPPPPRHRLQIRVPPCDSLTTGIAPSAQPIPPEGSIVPPTRPVIRTLPP